MRKVYIVLSLVLLMSLCSCNSSLIKPTLNNSAEVVAKDGTIFTILRIENSVPDQEISIVVTSNEQEVFACYNIANHLDEYDYSNDIVDKFGEIINENVIGDIKVYQFRWGIIYTLDGGNTFLGLAKHDYDELNSDDVIGQIVSSLK
ncbi:MAG: hypothetical protein IJ333_05070 [Clostridia bacterium]|nr:hypothetical protein [Clostridia bacterium]